MTADARPRVPFADRVPEPFRGDRRFWRSVFASADMLATLAAAVLAAVPLMVWVGAAWALVPFTVPAVFGVVAAAAGLRSARTSVRFYAARGATRRSWRDAERSAVAQVFWPALVRNRLRVPGASPLALSRCAQHVHRQNG